MDGLSLIVGGVLGILAGWAFSSASVKQREANRKLNRASKAQEEMTKKKNEAKTNKDSSFTDTLQGYLLYSVGFVILCMLAVFLFGSIG